VEWVEARPTQEKGETAEMVVLVLVEAAAAAALQVVD
jgi:hypothetical protein